MVAACCSADAWSVNANDSKTPLELKNEGNTFFLKGDYDQAIEKYSMALNKVPSAVLFGNRSQAYMKKELYGAALEDAASAITMDEGYVKGFFRRASAYMALGKYKKALRDYEAICRVHPKDIDASKRRDECKKIVKRIAFEQAISVDHNKKHITEKINLDAIEVEETYSGPRLDGPITLAFMKELIEYLKVQKKLHIKYVFKMLFDVYAHLKTLPNMVEIELSDDEQITLCGDVHGQFYDLCHIFEMRGLPSENNPYLFNGDFVDRGSFSVETILTLFGFKLLFPHHFFLTRGNHETECYGFEGEVKAKYNALLSEFFSEVFCYLPLCHLINRKIFVCHGGLFSKDNVTFDDIQGIDRTIQPPDEGIMCDLLWADPSPTPGRAPSRRGVSILFGPDVSKKWCEDNGILCIIRSHEVKNNGWESDHDGRVFTLFSAPNYCDHMANKGAYAVVTGKNLHPQFHTFEAVEHPNVPAMAYASNAFGL